MTGIVAEAIENAASADDESLGTRATVSERRLCTAREIIRRFLEDVPGEMTAMEMLDQIEAAR